MVLWVVAAVGLVTAIAALAAARRASRRLDLLNQSYWELRYDYTRLRAQVARLDPDRQDGVEEPPASTAAPSVSFVPLSSIRKRHE